MYGDQKAYPSPYDYPSADDYSFLEMSSTIDMDDQKNDEGTYDTFGAYVRGELRCEECGKPLTLKKGKSGKFFLVCSDSKCKTFVWIEPKMVDDYLYFGSKNGRTCPEDGTSLTAGKGKKNVYVGCNCSKMVIDKLTTRYVKINL